MGPMGICFGLNGLSVFFVLRVVSVCVCVCWFCWLSGVFGVLMGLRYGDAPGQYARRTHTR